MSEKAESFHLAWHKLDIPRACDYLIYTLVPAHVQAFKGALRLCRISYSGVTIESVSASAFELASPRRPGCLEGEADPGEVRLIRQLHLCAGRAQTILPAILPTRSSRDWAKLALSDAERLRLFRAAGVV